MGWLNFPNGLSLARPLLLPVQIWTLTETNRLAAVLVFAVVVLTDLCDGPFARRRGTPDPRGTLIDHGADAVFVTGVAATGAALGILPPWIAVLIPLAFIQYACAVRRADASSPRRSQLGRFNGISYYVLAGSIIAARTTSSEALRMVPVWLSWLLVVTTLLSILERSRQRS